MFFRPNNSLLFAGAKLKSTYKSLELTTAYTHVFPQSSTILLPEVYRSRSVGVDSGRSLNDFRKEQWSRS